MKKIYKIFIIICIFLYLFSLFACKKVNDENVFIETMVTDIAEEKVVKNAEKENVAKKIEYIMNEPFEVYDEGMNGFAQIYVMRNQSEGQILSIYITTNEGRGIVIDGGRVEDGEFLNDFIQKMGTGVEGWLLTHCHDDHVGALYSILENQKDIDINNFYYKFPMFEWLYKLIGVDAGAINLVNNKICEYCDRIKNINFIDSEGNIMHFGNIYNDISAGDIIDIDNVHIEVMNDMYLIENDPVNNSTIVYKIDIEYYDNDGNRKDKYIIVLGDLSYEGGIKLLEERGEDLKSDICVVAHHGQGGVWKEVYEAINPKICIWPTTKKIYENADGKYRTDEVKGWFDEIGVEKHYTTVDNSIILK